MTNRFRLLTAGGAAAAALTAAALWPATPAAAGPSCDPGNHCAFWYNIGSARHDYFDSDPDFRNDTFTNGEGVDNNVMSASNSSTGNYRSVYYYGYNYSNFNFCVNPGGWVEYHQLTNDWVPGNYNGQALESGSMRLISGRSSACFG